MKSQKKIDHLERTAEFFRDKVMHKYFWEESKFIAAASEQVTYTDGKVPLGQTARSLTLSDSPSSLIMLEDMDMDTASEEWKTKTDAPSGSIMSPAKVCGLVDESKTVRRLRLLVANKDFTFKAGQWVDFFIPGIPVTGGFSMCSSPSLLKQEGALELAVKHTNHPPSLWVHTKCTVGSEVALRVGGEFFFDPQPSDSSVNLVLIAGGVGINPLYSILLHVADLYRHRESKGSGYEMGRVRLLYSAKNTSELLFKKSILNLTNAFPGKIMCSFYVTQQTTEISEDLLPYVTEGRIPDKDLEEHISEDTVYFLCGPPPMIEHFSHHLETCKVPKEHICFEKWW